MAHLRVTSDGKTVIYCVTEALVFSNKTADDTKTGKAENFWRL